PIPADSRIPPPHLHIPATAGFLPGEILLSARWGGVRWGGGGVGRSGVAGGSGSAVAARTAGCYDVGVSGRLRRGPRRAASGRSPAALRSARRFFGSENVMSSVAVRTSSTSP